MTSTHHPEHRQQDPPGARLRSPYDTDYSDGDMMVVGDYWKRDQRYLDAQEEVEMDLWSFVEDDDNQWDEQEDFEDEHDDEEARQITPAKAAPEQALASQEQQRSDTTNTTKKGDWKTTVHVRRRNLAFYWRNHRVAIVWCILYVLANVAAFYYKAFLYATQPEHETARKVFGECLVIARGAANCINLNALLILLPLCRHLFTWLRNLRIPVPFTRKKQRARLQQQQQLEEIPEQAPLASMLQQPTPKQSHRNWRYIAVVKLFPFDSLLPMHQLFGCVFAYWTAVHVGAHMCDFTRFAHHPEKDDLIHLLRLDGTEAIMPSDPGQRWLLVLQTPAAITGVLMVLCMIVSYLLIAFAPHNFDAFYITHHLLLIMLLLLCLHGMGSILEPFESVYWVGVPLLLYAVPRIWREVAGPVCSALDRVMQFLGCAPTHRSEKLPQKVRGNVLPLLDVQVKPGKVVALKMVKPKSWNQGLRAGMYVNINVPQVSLWEWHPFTLTSAPCEPFLELHIRVVGDWTGDLHTWALEHQVQFQEARILAAKQLAASGTTLSSAALDHSSSPPVPLAVKLEGPIGASAQGFSLHRVIVLIGAGIGITPMISVMKELLVNPGKMERCYLFWTFRDKESLEWFETVMEDVFHYQSQHQHGDQPMLEIRLFLTSAKGEADLTAAASTARYCLVESGRPDWSLELTQVRNRAQDLGHGKCAIFFCGSDKMRRAIRNAAFRISRESYPEFHFYCRNETFNA